MAEGEKNNLEALRNTPSEVDFGMEIENIADLDTPKPAEADKEGEKDKDIKDKAPNISISDNRVEGDEDLGAQTKDKEDETDDHSTTVGEDDIKFNALLKTLGEQAKEKGVLDFNAEEFEKAPDKDQYFNDKLASTIESKVKEKFEQEISVYKAENLPAEINELIELHKKGVPLYSLLESDQNIASIEAISPKEIEDDASLQKNLVIEALRAQGFAKDKIDAKVKRYEDLGSMKDEALESREVLISIEKERKQELIRQETINKQNAIAQRNNKIAEITSTINTREEILPGFKLTPDDRKTLIEGITKMSHFDKEGRQINALQKARIDDPLHDLKLAYFTLVLKGDLSKIKAKTETAVSKKLKDALDTQDKMGSNQHDNAPRSATKFDRNVLRNALRNVK